MNEYYDGPSNPLLDQMIKLQRAGTIKQSFKPTIKNKQFPILPPMPFIPQNMPPWAEERSRYNRRNLDFEAYYAKTTQAFKLNEFYKFQHGMYAFVCWDWVRPLAEWIGDRRCLEVMAGRGFLSYALQECGVNVIATDDYSWYKQTTGHNVSWAGTPLMTEIEELDAVEAVKKYCDVDIVLMSWPYMDLTSYNVVTALREANPNALIVHIGEGGGGCTDSDEFFDAIEEVEDEDFYNNVAPKFLAWDMLHDRLNLFRPIKETIENE